MNPQHFGNYICLSGNPDSNPRSLLVEVRRLGGGVCSLREHNVLPVAYLAAVSTRTIPLQVTTCILLYNNVTLSETVTVRYKSRLALFIFTVRIIKFYSVSYLSFLL